MSDAWEVEYGLNPRSAEDGAADPDNDGLSNLQEYQQGRDPVAFDTLRLGSCLMLPDGTFRLTATGVPGRTYTIEISTNLAEWSALTNLSLNATSGSFLDSTATNATQRFYRLRE
jgi:hypothetical protein